MRFFSYFKKTFRENMRDWMLLIMAVTCSPMFVYLMFAYMNGSGAPTYTAAVINRDAGGTYAAALLEQWRQISDGGKSSVSLVYIDTEAQGVKMIKDKTADIMVTIPSGFSKTFESVVKNKSGKIAPLHNSGDMSNLKFAIVASLLDYTTYTYVADQTRIESPLEIVFAAVGSEQSKREFDLFFPALLVFSLIMVLFTAAASLVREVEKGTVARLILSQLTPVEFLGAVSANQLLVGTLCLAVTYAAGVSVGYHSTGSFGLLLLLGTATCFSVIAISIITACFIRTLFGLLTVGCFPFFILMFFSDCFMPLPKFPLFKLASHPVYLNDVLPTAIATRAFNKILNFDAGFGDIAFEFFAIVALSLVYFAFGAWLFKKRHLSAR